MPGWASSKQARTWSRLHATSDLGAVRAAGCAAPLSLAQKNAEAARQAVKTIRESVQILALQPGIGRPAQDMEPEYREWLIDFGQSG